MSVTFDGNQKLIICNPGTVSLTAQGLYSDWKEWVQSGQGISFLPAFEAIGGQPLPGGLFAGQTYFLVNDWKIKPQSANHRLTILGNLYTSDGSPTTVSVPGYTIEISLNTSSQAQGIVTSGSSLTAGDVWSYSDRTLTDRSSTSNIGLTLNQIEASTVLAKQAELNTLLNRLTETRASKLDRDLAHSSDANTYKADVSGIPTAIDNVLSDNFSAILAAISLLPSTASIADLKLLLEEIHLLHGLKLGNPLTVTDTQRIVGTITQIISSSSNQTTVSRI